jgi:hypothetical protein
LYPIEFDPYQLVERIIAMTPDEADFNTKSIIGAHPNTYTFTYAFFT